MIDPKGLDLTNRDRTDYTKELNVPDTTYDQYIKFQPTDRAIDAGLHTIPYIDLQEVITDPPTPLSGAALTHKGVKGYGGYLALELRTLAYENYVNEKDLIIKKK